MRWAALTASALLAAGCSCRPKPLAEGEGVAITADDLRAAVKAQAPAPAPVTPEQKRALLEKVIDFEVLVAEARRKGLGGTKEESVRQLLRERQNGFEGLRIPSEEERRAKFEADVESHRLPEGVVLEHLFVRAATGAIDRAQRLDEAKALEAQARAAPAAFAELVRVHSDEADTAQGDPKPRSRAELELKYSKPIADAVFALGQPGEFTGLLEADAGLHLFRLVQRVPARIPSYDEFRAAQSEPLTRAERELELRALTGALRTAAKVVIHEEALRALDLGAAPHNP